MKAPRKARFWDRIAARYARRPVANEAAYQHKLQKTREYFRPDSQVLELGCGTGSTAIAHAPHVARVHATDISANMLAIARDKITAAGMDNISLECAEVTDLSFAEAQFDVVLALSLLHLLDEREVVIARAYRWLRPGGVLVTSTPCLGDHWGFLKWILTPGAWLGLVPRVSFFTRNTLVSNLTDAGFDLDYQWQPGKSEATFIIARKPHEEPVPNL